MRIYDQKYSLTSFNQCVNTIAAHSVSTKSIISVVSVVDILIL